MVLLYENTRRSGGGEINKMVIECIPQGEKLICRAVVHPSLWTWEWFLVLVLGFVLIKFIWDYFN